MKKLTISYFGTPYFSAQFLEKLLNDSLPAEVIFVVTQPNKPVGRKQIVTPSPVKQIAQKYGVEVIEFDSRLWREKIKNVDVAFLYAYSGFISNDLLNLPKFGFLNIHPSLLPKYRGPSPMAYPLIFGENQTGVTLIKLDEEIDHGPILMQQTIKILPNDLRPDLAIKLTDLAYEMFKKLVIRLTSSKVEKLESKEQNHKEAIYTRRLDKEDGFIPFVTLQKALKNDPLTQEELPEIIRNLKSEIKNSPKIIYNYFRGLYPWPGIWTSIQPAGLSWDGPKRLKITDMDLKDNKLILKKVQIEGKNEVDFKTFQSAYNVFTT